jgi:hypothetical protein
LTVTDYALDLANFFLKDLAILNKLRRRRRSFTSMSPVKALNVPV